MTTDFGQKLTANQSLVPEDIVSDDEPTDMEGFMFYGEPPEEEEMPYEMEPGLEDIIPEGYGFQADETDDDSNDDANWSSAAISEKLRGAAAGFQGDSVENAEAQLGRVTKSHLAELGKASAAVWTSIFDSLRLLVSISSSVTGLDWAHVLEFEDSSLSPAAADEVRQIIDAEPVRPAAQAVLAVLDTLQRRKARSAYLKVAYGLENAQYSHIELEELHDNLPRPTLGRGSVERPAYFGHIDSFGGTKSQMRFSSGIPGLDRALSVPGKYEHSGVLSPGENGILAAASGSGKSALCTQLLTGMTLDLVHGWGYSLGKTAYCMTEMTAVEAGRLFELGAGQANRHLADNIEMVEVNSDRSRIVEWIYYNVKQANEWAKITGQPITRGPIPWIMVVDYLQGMQSDGEAASTDAVRNSSKLLMAAKAFDPVMMARWSGLSYEEYAQEEWPAGLEEHRMAVIGVSQFRKTGSDAKNELASLDVENLHEFVKSGPFRGREEQSWPPKVGDRKILTEADMSGSADLINDAYWALFPHRPNPRTPILTRESGENYIEDTRGGILIGKARNGKASDFVRVSCNSARGASRLHYYDWDAGLVLSGKEEDVDGLADSSDLSFYRRVGDPILPKRPSLGAFVGKRY